MKKELGSWSGSKILVCYAAQHRHSPVIIYEDDEGADIFDWE